MTDRAAYHGPLGPIVITANEARITSLAFTGEASPPATTLLSEACRQIAAYFDGSLTEFDLPLDTGEGFRARFLAALIAIPFGETRTYGDLAQDLGVSAQAIGQACGANPIPLIIPCHRILGATGLGGFSGAGGVETKVALLKHEKAAGLLI